MLQWPSQSSNFDMTKMPQKTLCRNKWKTQ